MITKTTAEAKAALEKALQKDIANLYNENFINWGGKLSDNKITYSEFFARVLIEQGIIEKLANITPINREKSYKVEHDAKVDVESNRGEEIFAKKLIQKEKDYSEIGRFIDYQVPLKGKQADNAGKIDLVSYNKDSNVVYLHELKLFQNSDTLLKCILQIETYYRLLNHEKFKKSFNFKEEVKIKKSLLIFENSDQHKEIENLADTSALKELIKKLDINIFLIIVDIKDIKRVNNLKVCK